MNKVIYNPSDSKVTINILGKVYSVEPKGVVDVEDAHVDKWLATHSFLELSEQKVAKKEVEKSEEESEELKKKTK